ncbi:MAG: glutaredoxin family protein [Gammaproteobacteria bacterium]
MNSRRGSGSSPLDLVLYGRQDCSLCDVMAEAVLAAAGDAVRLVRVDIDEDPALVAKWSDDVPVLCLGDEVVSRHFLDAGRLRRLLGASP